MSISDSIITFIVWVVQNTLLRLPTSISAISQQDLGSTISSIGTTFGTGLAMLNVYIPVVLIIALVVAILIAEPALHFGWKGVKWLINIFRGSGG